MSKLLHNEGKLTKNHFIFCKNNINYYENINGDERLNIFKPELMNIYLEKFEDEIGTVVYDDIIQISTIENHDETITVLPNNLKSLFIMSSMCKSLTLPENVKNTIEYLHIDHSNMSAIPNIDGCNKLISFKINHSCIKKFSIEYDLSPNLIELNLSNNLITHDNFAYQRIIDKINSKTLKNISFTDNYLDYNKFPEILQFKVKLFRQGRYKFNIIDFRNVGREHIHNFIYEQFIIPNAPLDFPLVRMPIKPHILNSTQTVHLSSINNSVIKSISTMNNFIEINKIQIKSLKFNDNSLFNIIINTFEQMTSKIEAKGDSIQMFKYFVVNYETFELKRDFSIESKHSISKLTYQETFKIVWSIICFLINKGDYKAEDLFERLSTDLKESNKVCFTGKYNRLINSLVGVLDGVNVGISLKEEIQLEFGKIIEKLNKKDEKYTFNNAICDANHIFDNSNNIEKTIWMEALLDLAPEPIKINHNNETYLKTWDSIILDLYYKKQVGLMCEQSEQIMFCTIDE